MEEPIATLKYLEDCPVKEELEQRRSFSNNNYQWLPWLSGALYEKEHETTSKVSEKEFCLTAMSVQRLKESRCPGVVCDGNRMAMVDIYWALERGICMRLGMLFSVITLRSQKSQFGKRERMGEREKEKNRANFQKWDDLPPLRVFSLIPGRFPLVIHSLIKKSMHPCSKFPFLALASHVGFWLLQSNTP